MSTSYEAHKSQVEGARKANGEFGSYSAGESGATLDGPGGTAHEPSFQETKERFEEAFAETGYAEVRRHHAVDSTGEPRRDGKQLKNPKVIKGWRSKSHSGDIAIADESSPGAVNYEMVRTPVVENVGSLTENEDGGFTIEHDTGEKWDIRTISWEEADKRNIGNPLEVTTEQEQMRQRSYDGDVAQYKNAVANDPGSVELRPTENGYEYDQDQLRRSERVGEERKLLVDQAMRTLATPGGREHVENSLGNLDVEGRERVKEALQRIDEPHYATARENTARSAEFGFGRDSVHVPNDVVEDKLTPGQNIYYKNLDQGPEAQWQPATVGANEHGGLEYNSENRSAMLTGSASTGKSFSRDKWGHYIQSSNAGWDGRATAFMFDTQEGGAEA